jgi:hypothetical protein
MCFGGESFDFILRARFEIGVGKVNREVVRLHVFEEQKRFVFSEGITQG